MGGIAKLCAEDIISEKALLEVNVKRNGNLYIFF